MGFGHGPGGSLSTSSLDESRATDATSTPQPRWPLRISLLVVLALFWLPLAFLVAIGWPTAAPPTADPGTRLIVPPSPPGGLPLDLIRWLIVFGGLGLGLALGLALTVWLFGQARRAGVELPGWRFTLLAVAGLLSLLVYALNLVLPFPLEPYYGMVVVCMNRIAEQDAGVALATTAAIVALFLLYALAYRLCRAQHGRRLWAIVLIGAVLLALLNLFVIPTSSTDVYDNLVRGRIADVYHGNTYVYTPVDYAWEPFAEYISWDDTTSAYGPLWEMLSAFISHVAGDHLWPNVLGHKLLALGSYLVSVALVAAILRRIAPDRALAGTLLWAWNPLILIEGVANAHNDMVMVALILGAFWFLNLSAGRAGHTGPRDWLYNGIALLLLTAGVLVKFVPALFLPFVILYLLLPEPSWRRRIGLGLLLLIPAALLVAEYYGVFWSWPAVADTFTRRTEMFRMSIPSVAVEALQIHIDQEAAKAAVRQPFMIAFALGYLALLVRTIWLLLGIQLPPRFAQLRDSRVARLFLGTSSTNTKRPIEILIWACLNALLLYLLLANFWFWPWYLIWPIALMALAGDTRLTAVLFLVAIGGELAMVAWNFVWYWWGITWDTLYQMDALVVLGMVGPALLAYIILSFKRQSRQPTRDT